MGAPFEKDRYDPLVTFAYEQLSLSTSISSLTAATFLNAKRAVLTFEGGSGRYRTDPLSSALTTATGVPVIDLDQVVLWGSTDIGQFKTLGQTSSVKLNAEYAK